MIEVNSPQCYGRPMQLAAAVLDWAGTTVDFGSRAPVAAMQAAFELAGVAVTEAEARRPMGRAKRDHLQAILKDPAVADRWKAKFGAPSSEADLDKIYEKFLAVQGETVADYSAIIPGCIEAVAECRDLGLKIGSSTGYTRKLLAKVAARAAAEGYSPDVSLSADDIAPGRPAPWLCVENARRLGVYPLYRVVKVDDTPAGVTAGRNAGCWSIGVVDSGNEVGLSESAFAELDPQQRDQMRTIARQKLREAGAHFLIDTIAELPTAVRRIDQLLDDGRLPH